MRSVQTGFSALAKLMASGVLATGLALGPPQAAQAGDHRGHLVVASSRHGGHDGGRHHSYRDHRLEHRRDRVLHRAEHAYARGQYHRGDRLSHRAEWIDHRRHHGHRHNGHNGQGHGGHYGGWGWKPDFGHHRHHSGCGH